MADRIEPRAELRASYSTFDRRSCSRAEWLHGPHELPPVSCSNAAVKSGGTPPSNQRPSVRDRARLIRLLIWVSHHACPRGGTGAEERRAASNLQRTDLVFRAKNSSERYEHTSSTQTRFNFSILDQSCFFIYIQPCLAFHRPCECTHQSRGSIQKPPHQSMICKRHHSNHVVPCTVPHRRCCRRGLHLQVLAAVHPVVPG